MHDFNQFRLSRQTEAPEAIDEAILREEQRLTYAKDICEAVGLEPQELLEMLQELIELNTHAQNVERYGAKRALELAASFKEKMASRDRAITNQYGQRQADPQAQRAVAMTQASLGADNVHYSHDNIQGARPAFGPSGNPRSMHSSDTQGFDVRGSANVGSLPAAEQGQAERIYGNLKKSSNAGQRRTDAAIAAANRAKGIARI